MMKELLMLGKITDNILSRDTIFGSGKKISKREEDKKKHIFFINFMDSSRLTFFWGKFEQRYK